jgi:hypothetical protein
LSWIYKFSRVEFTIKNMDKVRSYWEHVGAHWELEKYVGNLVGTQ